MSSAARLSRKLNPSKSSAVSVALNVQQIEHINELYSTGLYGSSPAAVVAFLFNEGLRRVINDTRGKTVASDKQQP